MADRKPVRILIVDDEPLARQRVEDLLRAEEDVDIVASVAGAAARGPTSSTASSRSRSSPISSSST